MTWLICIFLSIFAPFQDCMTGPITEVENACCYSDDLNKDHHIDLKDYALHQQITETIPWLPPIGIPEPPFGIHETVEHIYGSNYFTHYVDNTHLSATDSSNPNGSLTQPRKTVPSFLSAGSVVLMRGGPYNYTSTAGKLLIEGQGTPSQPVFVRGKCGDQPTFTKTIVPQGSYIILENLTLTGTLGIDVIPSGTRTINHLAVRGCTIAGPGTNAAGASLRALSYDGGNPVQNVVFYNNHVHHQGNSESATENDRHGIKVGQNASNIWVVDNHVHHNGGDAIQLAHNANFTCHHVYIGRNEFHNDRENAVDIKEANDVIVSQNLMYGYEPTSGALGETLVIHYYPTRIWVLYNYLYNANHGLVTTGSSDTYFIGNIISDMTDRGIHARNSSTVRVISNTIYNTTNAIHSWSASFLVYNNILALPSSYHVYVEGSSAISGTEIDYNIFWGTSSLSSGLSAGSHNIEGDPLLTPDLRINMGSPVIDAGTAHVAYDEFFALYGLDIKVDFDGISRYQGSSWDIGPFEQ